VFLFQSPSPGRPDVVVWYYLNQISNHLRNTSDPIFNDFAQAELSDGGVSGISVILLHTSLGLVLLDSALALFLKLLLHDYKRRLKTFHNPEEQVINRELYSHGLQRWAIPSLFELLPSLIQYSLILFLTSALFFLPCVAVFEIWTGLMSLVLFAIIQVFIYIRSAQDPYSPFILSLPPVLKVFCAWGTRRHKTAFKLEVAYLGVLNHLFIHTPMVSKHLSIFIQLFSLPIQHPHLRIGSLAPWGPLYSLLPSMLTKLQSQSRFDVLPVLRLCLVVSSQGQWERLHVDPEAKRACSAIKASNPLQNLYLHLLLSQLHATTEAADHWLDASQMLKCLEYCEEHTSELVWLVDSMPLHTQNIKEHFTIRVMEFLRGVVVYLGKCPRGNQNPDLLRTATIMAAEWLISRRSSPNGNPPRQYILSREGDPGGANQKMFSLVENQELSSAERVRRIVGLYEQSQMDDVIHALLIPIIAVEAFATAHDISGAMSCVRRDDLLYSLEGLWDLWEGGFDKSDLLLFVSAFVATPSSPIGGVHGSMADLLKEYGQQIDGSPERMTEEAFQFIGAALRHTLAGSTAGGVDSWLQRVELRNPCLKLHVANVLEHNVIPDATDLAEIENLDSPIKNIVFKSRLSLYLSSNLQPEPHILTLLVKSDDFAIALEGFGQGVRLLELPPTDESDGRIHESPPFTFELLKQNERSHLVSRFFDPQQSIPICQTVWIMFAEDLYPRWGLLPSDWRRDIAGALVGATEWMKKGQKVLTKRKRRGIRASRKAKQLIREIGIEHRRRKAPLETRDERFQERLDACAQIYLRLFAIAVEELGERAKANTQRIVDFLVDVPDVLYDEDATKRIVHVLEISKRVSRHTMNFQIL